MNQREWAFVDMLLRHDDKKGPALKYAGNRAGPSLDRRKPPPPPVADIRRQLRAFVLIRS